MMADFQSFKGCFYAENFRFYKQPERSFLSMHLILIPILNLNSAQLRYRISCLKASSVGWFRRSCKGAFSLNRFLILLLLVRELTSKGPLKLIQGVKIAHSFLQFVSNPFYFIILSLPM